MDYYLHSQGRNLGVFPLEELRRRRLAGQLTGAEYAWCQGMPNWRKLDELLQETRPVLPPGLPPLPTVISKPQKSKIPLWLMLVAAVGVLALGLFSWGLSRALNSWQRKTILSRIQTTPYRGRPDNDRSGLVAASKPVVISSNTVTEALVAEQAQLFRVRQWIDNYDQHGNHTATWDADARQLISVWQARNHGGTEATNEVRLDLLADKLARASDDPLVLTVAAINCEEQFESQRRLEAALAAFPRSGYLAYPQLYAAVLLAKDVKRPASRVAELDAESLQCLARAFTDGTFKPAEQAQWAEIFISGWASGFFSRNGARVCGIMQNAGKDYEWLALVLKGEHEISEAWRVRGGGYANTVTAAGWEGFRTHLATARESLMQAWKLHPDLPAAPARMIYVALGSSGIDEMRLWFDRTVAAQVDYPGAWTQLRWGLRSRWYGSHEAILALGITAVNTRRFDTDVPRILFESLTDLESELELPAGEHIYGREDVWPHLQAMYEGYIAEPSQQDSQAGWRSTYAAVAYCAGKYDVARAQLDAVNWQPWTNNFSGWGRDLSLMPLEVAARTGLAGRLVDAAEQSYHTGNLAQAAQLYTALHTNSLADVRTRAFVENRLAQLQLEQRLQLGDWVDFLPGGTNDPLWIVSRGQYERQTDGSLEVRSGKGGHLLYCRARVGMDFEARGEFEVMSSSSTAFQAGLVMGLPEFGHSTWYAYRIKRNDNEGDVVSFSPHWHEAKNTTKPVILNARTNSFSFRLQDGKVYGSVNGQDLLTGVDKPAGSIVSPAEFMVGLGAFNDQNDTVIRYRKVQVRKLVGQ